MSSNVDAETSRLRLKPSPASCRSSGSSVFGTSLWMVLAVAALLRLPTLGEQSFWLDEAATLSVLHHSFGGMLSAVYHHESTPPLYYVLAWLWSKLFGFGAFGLRSLSAVLGIATVPAVFLAARRCGGQRAAIIAGLLAACNPLLIWYSQEARAYALLAFFGACSFYWAARAADAGTDRRRDLVWWAVAAALGLASHYFAVFYVVPEAAMVLQAQRARAVPAVLGVGVVAGLLLPLALHQRAAGHSDWITGTPLRTRLALIPKQYVTGLNAPHQAVLAGLVLLSFAALLGALLLRRQYRTAGSIWATSIFVIGPIVMGVLAIVGIDLVLTRNALGLLPIGLIAVGCGFAALPQKARQFGSGLVVLIVVVSLVVVATVVTDRTYQRTDWRDAAKSVGVAVSPQLVELNPPSNALPLSPYLRLHAVRHGIAPRARRFTVITFLLSAQGAAVGPGAATAAPAGFRLAYVKKWPGLLVTEFRSISGRAAVLRGISGLFQGTAP
jgi:uncharacterized membrane protein